MRPCTLVLGYTVSDLSFGDRQPNELDLTLWLAEAHLRASRYGGQAAA